MPLGPETEIRSLTWEEESVEVRRPGEETRHAVLRHEAAVRQREVGEAREAGSQVQHHGVAQVLVRAV